MEKSANVTNGTEHERAFPEIFDEIIAIFERVKQHCDGKQLEKMKQLRDQCIQGAANDR